MPDLDARRRRLVFRANHRGTKEADLMIGGFVARHVASLGPAELDEIETLLDHPDVDLADWLMGRRAPPEEVVTPLFRRMLAEAGLR
jgi:antitoxin CptB